MITEFGDARSILTNKIDSFGKTIVNFDESLPENKSDLIEAGQGIISTKDGVLVAYGVLRKSNGPTPSVKKMVAVCRLPHLDLILE
jgi:hypothetical protein